MNVHCGCAHCKVATRKCPHCGAASVFVDSCSACLEPMPAMSPTRAFWWRAGTWFFYKQHPIGNMLARTT